MNLVLLESIKKIHKKISNISDITLEEISIIAPIIKLETIPAGAFFMIPGESSQKVAFTLNGLAKTYYDLENGKELISHFGSEGSFVGVYTDMLKNIPSTGYIQAVEDCTFIVMNYREMLQATKNNLSWSHLLRTIAEQRYIYRSDKDRNMTLKSAQEKYEYFKLVHPDLVDRLPQNQIASYLNITAATLSRLKNNSGNYKK